MKNKRKYLVLALAVSLTAVFFSLYAGRPAYAAYETSPQAAGADTLPARFPVAKTLPEEYDDILKRPAVDLRDPENVQTTIEYDLRSGAYMIRTRVGDAEIGTPLMLTPEEYLDYDMQQSMRSYFRQRNEEAFRNAQDGGFNLMDMQFDIGPAERIFGKGGVRVRPQGSAEIRLGLKQNKTDNPTLPERARNRTFFNFEQDIQLNVQASVGTKVNFNMNYNTETTLDFDTKRLRLAYMGEEDEIVKSLEAGNVSMNTNNSLIHGGAALFGVKADLQFGKLRVNALLAQQESESQTVNARGGVQTRPFEIAVDQYDENRHFFLGHYFRNNYDYALEQLPYVRSAVTINRVEVWITNKRSNFNQARNIVAFTDLGEYNQISNTEQVQPQGSLPVTYNDANNLYRRLLSEFPGARESSRVNQILGGVMEGNRDYEKIESARLLSESEYRINRQLGYISLITPLQPDEVLAVAFDFQYNGTAYQVGEFSTDNTLATSANLYVKLLKGTSMSPDRMFWDLMMKNIYYLNAFAVQKEKFRLDILYQSDTTGTYINYLTEGNIKDQILLKVMNLDRLDMKNEPYPDGFYDFVDGFTIQSDNGLIIFPVVEPFGSHLRKKIANDAVAGKYVYEELYDSTLTVARQIAEKNKFILRGEYKASSGAEIQLGGTNVARGSVRVTAGGQTLAENVDYVVDYSSGIVTILNENIITSGTPVSVTLENQAYFSRQRKTMMGLDLNYQFNKNFSLGGTIMHLSEMPVTTKTAFGDESIRNTLWGLNTSYKTESQWLTNMLDKLPLLTLTRPSQLSFNAEFAHLIAGHYENQYTGRYSYLDDFESTQSGFDLLNPYPWNLASTPFEDGVGAPFPEAASVNDINYGKNRALLAWYYIDGMFTRPNSTLAPSHIRGDKEQLSNHYVRAIRMDELFPDQERGYNESNILPALNIAFYPNTRGPYNLDADGMNSDGTLMNPEKRWGGMMRKIDQSDFEAANIEYIEFWMLDPYVYKPNAGGGDLYFNLGEISEDVLKDEKKFFENGLPIDGDTSKIDYTVWGKVPRMQSTVYAFDNTAGARRLQDVGFNGLSSEEEQNYPAYRDYLIKLQDKLLPEAYERFRQDPAADNFRHYRGADLDRDEVSILERYKYYNGTEGNSAAAEDQQYSSSSRTTPDVEDFNQDNTMNENERYFQYRVSIRPQDMEVGKNYIVSKREASVKLENGTTETVNWFQFKIPVKQYTKTVGSIRDFKTIRFMRMYMTGFSDTVILRLGTFELVRGQWRTYTQDLSNPSMPSSPSGGNLDVSSVNIEENSNRTPVNYVLPPGVSRMIDPGQPQIVQQNEQSLSLKITNLASQDARAVYKNTYYDMRQYKRLQLFAHAEAFIDDITGLGDDDLSVFIRLGSDYKNNYYEYEVPLKLTRHRDNNTTYLSSEAVWPAENTMNFRFEVLTELKLKRNNNRRMGQAGVSFQSVYSEYDPDNTRNKISVVGNPSLSEVKIIMIGVRNNSRDTKSAEIWVNELRLTDFNEDGGWAANANLNLALSDLGTLNMAGRMETTGFGGLDQSVNERRIDEYKQYSVATNLELGKFFPEKAKVSIPFYYAYSKEIIDPKYNPLDQDIILKDAVNSVDTQTEKDSIISLARERSVIKSIALNNIKVDIRSKTPMPYDPANFTFGYSFSENQRNRPEVEYETTKDYQANFTYNYTPYLPPFRPFAALKKENGYTRYAKQLSINYLPSSISFQTAMMRNYYEMQMRNLSNPGASSDKSNLLSFSQNFYWDRAFRLEWRFTNSLRISFSSGTNARIEEPHVQVNRALNPDKYQVWKDSVLQSIADLGTPMKYDQSLNLSYQLPLQFIPILDWVNASATYNATYNWDRGATIDQSIEIGNTIKNQRQLNVESSFNMLNFYNKSKFLGEINRKFNASPRSNTTPPKPLQVEKTVQLNPDSGTVVQHDMLSKRLIISARDAKGNVYRLRYTPLDFIRVRIENKDTVKLALTLRVAPSPTDNFFYQAAERTLHLLMMVRRVNIRYTTSGGMMIPGFRPEIGDWFGQGATPYGLAPGVGFAFGDISRSYIDQLAANGWLVMSQTNINPAIIRESKSLIASVNIEPIAGLKIDLNANREEAQNTEIQYMYNGMPELKGGSFMMTTITAGSFFEGMGNMANGYASNAFNAFLQNREIITRRIENQYAGTTYPNTGFIANTSLANQPYNPANGSVSPNATDVLIPAFLAAYTGKDASKISLTPFPSLTGILPNWQISYAGLVQIPAVKKHFKSLTLIHQYRSSYSVGAYSSFLNWVDAGHGELGYVQDVLTSKPIPSSQYSISSANITEAFNPLIGVDGLLLNNITLGASYTTNRNLNLNISSFQLVETRSDMLTVSLGYKLTEFNKALKLKPARNFSNDLTLRMDFSYRKMQSLIRKIQELMTQATSGNVSKTIRFSADYGVSRSLTLRAYYDLEMNTPLISSASYATSNANYGISIRFTLSQ